MQSPPQQRVFLGVLLMLGFSFFAPMIDVFAKLAAAQIPVLEIVATRFLVQSALVVPVVWYCFGLQRPSARESGLYLLRGALNVIGSACFVGAVHVMPLADALAVFFIEPFILSILAAVFLGETLGWRRIFACTVGFIGALMVIQPQYALIESKALLPVGTALSFACYLLLTRRMTQSINPLRMQAYTGVAASLIIVPILLVMDHKGLAGFHWVRPQGAYVVYLLGVGLAATIAHIFLTYAFANAPATTLAPLQYLEIVAATMFGYWVFNDVPNAMTIAGVAVIVSAGLYVFFREQRLAIDARRSATGEH